MSTGITKSDDQLKASISTDPFEMSERKEGSNEQDTPPYRQIRALFDDETITVYQAYKTEIALDAVRLGRFPPSYNRNRMTWIKPSFLWMMYRCGYATKENQEHVLAIRLRRDGFEAALAEAAARETPVRIQWDPERDLHHKPLSYRSIQIGLSGRAMNDYCDRWITGIDDVTELVHSIRALIKEGLDDEARALLPKESPYPLTTELATHINANIV